MRIEFNESIFNAEEVLNLLVEAGMSDGYGGWRKGKGGTYGSYEVCQKPGPERLDSCDIFCSTDTIAPGS